MFCCNSYESIHGDIIFFPIKATDSLVRTFFVPTGLLPLFCERPNLSIDGYFDALIWALRWASKLQISSRSTVFRWVEGSSLDYFDVYFCDRSNDRLRGCQNEKDVLLSSRRNLSNKCEGEDSNMRTYV